MEKLCAVLWVCGDTDFVTPQRNPLCGSELLGKASLNDEVLQWIVEGNGIEAILQTMAKNMDNEKILAQGTFALGALSCSEDNIRRMLAAGAPGILLEAIKRHIGNKSLVQQCIFVVSQLALIDEAKSVLMEGGVLSCLAMALNAHRGAKDLKAVILEAVEALVSKDQIASIVQAISKAAQLVRKRRGEVEATELELDIGILECCAMIGDNVSTIILKKGVTTVRDAMDIAAKVNDLPRQEEVLVAGMRCLQQIAKNENAEQPASNAAVCKGAVPKVIDVFKKHIKLPTFCLEGDRLIQILSEVSGNVDALVDGGCLEALLWSLRALPEDAAVCATVAGAYKNMAISEGVSIKIARTGGTRELLKCAVLTAGRSDAYDDFVCETFRVIEKVSAYPLAKEVITKQKGVKSIISVMESNYQNQKIVSLGGRALERLITEEQLTAALETIAENCAECTGSDTAAEKCVDAASLVSVAALLPSRVATIMQAGGDAALLTAYDVAMHANGFEQQEAVVVPSILAIERLTKRNAIRGDTEAASKVLETLKTYCDGSLSSKSAVAKSIFCLAQFGNDPAMADGLVQGGAVSFLVELWKKYGSNKEIKGNVKLALSVLANYEEGTKLVVESGGIQLSVHDLEGQNSDKRDVQDSLQLLISLSSMDENLPPIVEAGAIEKCSEAFKLHMNDAATSGSAVEFLQRLSSEDQYSAAIVEAVSDK